MDLMVNPVITGFRQDVDGTIKELKLGEAKQDAYANIIGQAETADLENNKATTINVSTYTAPVEITPTRGKDGMKKATVTLSNIPSGGSTELWAWKSEDESSVVFTSPNPTTSDSAYDGSGYLESITTGAISISEVDEDYDYIVANAVTYNRDTQDDISF